MSNSLTAQKRFALYIILIITLHFFLDLLDRLSLSCTDIKIPSTNEEQMENVSLKCALITQKTAAEPTLLRG